MALLAMAAAALCWVPAFLHCELRSMLMLQKNAGTRFPALRIHSEVAVVFLQAHSANELAHDNGPGSVPSRSSSTVVSESHRMHSGKISRSRMRAAMRAADHILFRLGNAETYLILF